MVHESTCRGGVRTAKAAGGIQSCCETHHELAERHFVTSHGKQGTLIEQGRPVSETMHSAIQIDILHYLSIPDGWRQKALKHGQIIGPASRLIFSSKALGRDFLNQKGSAGDPEGFETWTEHWTCFPPPFQQ